MSHPSERPPEPAPAEEEVSLEKPSMNLLTNYDATMAALIAMEGKSWFTQEQKTRGWANYSTENALVKSRVGCVSVIHGAFGGRRYQVDEKGNVELRRESLSGTKQMIEKDVRKATGLGFRLV